MSLPDGSNIQVYRNQGAVALAADALQTSGSVVSVGGFFSGTAVQRIARTLASRPAQRFAARNRSRRIFWN
jgi:hypothetical protein